VFAALLLDAKHRIIGVHVVSIGSLTESPAHPREVFRAAIVAGAAAVIFGHNHPSGDVTPSPEDVATTRRLIEAGMLLGINVLDPVIRRSEFGEFGGRGEACPGRLRNHCG
jgi:DNA repair protein RadC